MVFLILGSFVFYISTRISEEMSLSALSNLTESLELIKGAVETYFENEAEYQKLLAKEIAVMDNPEDFVSRYESSDMMIKLSLVLAGSEQGISNTGGIFSPGTLSFP